MNHQIDNGENYMYGGCGYFSSYNHMSSWYISHYPSGCGIFCIRGYVHDAYDYQSSPYNHWRNGNYGSILHFGSYHAESGVKNAAGIFYVMPHIDYTWDVCGSPNCHWLNGNRGPHVQTGGMWTRVNNENADSPTTSQGIFWSFQHIEYSWACSCSSQCHRRQSEGTVHVGCYGAADYYPQWGGIFCQNQDYNGSWASLGSQTDSLV